MCASEVNDLERSFLVERGLTAIRMARTMEEFSTD